MVVNSWTHQAAIKATLSFLSGIYDSHKKEELAWKTAHTVFDVIVKGLTSKDNLVTTQYRCAEQRRISQCYATANVQPELFIQLVRQCIELDFVPNILELLETLKAEASKGDQPAITFKSFFLKFVKEMCELVTDQNLSPTTRRLLEAVKSLTQHMIEAYTTRCVGSKPTAPTDWYRAKYGCGCADCQQLDPFLAHPTQELTRVVVEDDEGVEHIKDRLPKGDYRTPEYDILSVPIPPSFELVIRKIDPIWLKAMKEWEEDRVAAQKEFDKVFTDERSRNSLREHLKRLIEGSNK